MVRVKICGITSLEDGLAAAKAGADMLGLNLYPKSPRFVTTDAAQKLVSDLQDELGENCPLLIGLFVNEEAGMIRATLEKVSLEYAQLSGDEPQEALLELKGRAYKSIRPRSMDDAAALTRCFSLNERTDEDIPSLLLDAYNPALYGGTGEQASLEVALIAKSLTPRMMLAGGLKPENVAEMVTKVHPWGVDVASGVEIEGNPGQKDAVKMRDFVQAAKGI
jgi:phosphoribosylanthranilate isomerase